MNLDRVNVAIVSVVVLILTLASIWAMVISADHTRDAKLKYNDQIGQCKMTSDMFYCEKVLIYP